MKKLLLFSFLFVLANIGKATTYYISAKGDDKNTGTSILKAWKSITAVNTQNYSAGDSILFEGGNVFYGNVYFSPKSFGSKSLPIIVSSYGKGKATIDAGNGTGIFLYNNSGFSISKLNIIGSGLKSNSGQGIFFYNDLQKAVVLDFLKIDRLEVKHFGKNGIDFLSYPSDTSRSGYSNITITHSVSDSNGIQGISFLGSYKITDTLYCFRKILIDHCITHHNGGSGIIIGQTDSALVQRCVSYENGITGGGVVGIWTWDSKYIVIQYNESHHNHTKGSDGDGFDLDGGVQNSVLQYNYSHDNEGAGYLLWQYDFARYFRNNICRYNISENDSRKHDGYYGIVAIGGDDSTAKMAGVHSTWIYNNTFYKKKRLGTADQQGAAVSIDGGIVDGIKVFNNIFLFDSNNIFVRFYKKHDVQFYNNNYYGNSGFKFIYPISTFSNITQWQTKTGQETIAGKRIGLKVNPLLVNPGKWGINSNIDSLNLTNFYKLQPFSPMVNSGINGDSLFPNTYTENDFYGDTLHPFHQFGIGAHEVQPYHFAPIPNFKTMNNCINDTTIFKDSSNYVNKYEWEFGDGNTSTLASPKHKYSSPGDYVVKLVTSSKYGKRDSIFKKVSVFKLPNAKFLNNYIGGSRRSFLPLDTTLKSYFWIFNDPFKSSTSTKMKPEFVFSTVGYKSITLKVRDTNNCINSSLDSSFIITSFNKINNGKTQITVYPNPFIDDLNIQSNELFTLQIMDLNGKIIFEEQKEIFKFNRNLKYVPSGIYQMKIKNRDGIISKKIIKL